MDNPYKDLLSRFIYDRIPDLLSKHGGQMLKTQAHEIVHDAFKMTHGDAWNHLIYDQIQNAWGWALTWHYRGGTTELCAKSDYYTLRFRDSKPMGPDATMATA